MVGMTVETAVRSRAERKQETQRERKTCKWQRCQPSERRVTVAVWSATYEPEVAALAFERVSTGWLDRGRIELLLVRDSG